MIGDIVGLLILLADIWAISDVVQRGPSPAMKVTWILIILVLPLVGLLLWFGVGPRKSGP